MSDLETIKEVSMEENKPSNVLYYSFFSIFTVVTFLLYLWALPSLYFMLGSVAAWLFFLGSVGSFVLLNNRKRTLYIVFAISLIVTICQQSMRPTNDRDWRPSVARLPQVTIKGDVVDIKNIRNFEYRTEHDFTPRYYEKRYYLSELKTLDYILSYWDGNTKIAHTMLSFGFKNGDYITVSVETRLSKDEEQSLLGGFFNQYELIYILGDERDLLRLRTNFRKEEVYLYRLNVKPNVLEKIFVQIVRRASGLNEHPRFYNTLKHNCMTTLLSDVREAQGKAYSFDPHFIFNGLSDQLLYKQGAFMTGGYSFKKLRELRHINQYVTDKPNAEIHYSQKIRPKGSGLEQ